MSMYRITSISVLVLAPAVAVLAQNKPIPQPTPQSAKSEWNFDKDEVGKPSSSWRTAETSGTGKTGRWTVVRDDSAPSKPNVLRLETQAAGKTYSLYIAEKSSFKDLDLRVRIRANSGEEDQGGGPIWRCRDENNYYICRINPLEGNFRVYKVQNGKRSELESAKLETKTGQWYEVRAVMVGDKIECFVDGRKYLEATDSTFKDAGSVGLWTKADASSSFDDVGVWDPVGDSRKDPPDNNGEVIQWQASPVEQSPVIDGMQDAVWSKASPVKVVVGEAIGGGSPRTVTLRAIYTEDTLYILAQWPDATRSDMRDPYVWNATKNTYERPTRPDDQFALEFPISGQFDRNMLSTEREFEADVWHWKAGRGNPNGWVDDKRHIIRHSSFVGAMEYQLGGHATVFIARPNDAGTVPYKVRPAPVSHSGDVVDSFEPQKPTGSCADVRGKGVHDGSTWTLEMARKLNTGNPDDAVVHLDRENACAIAVLDDELYWNHSVSPLLHLRFSAR